MKILPTALAAYACALIMSSAQVKVEINDNANASVRVEPHSVVIDINPEQPRHHHPKSSPPCHRQQDAPGCSQQCSPQCSANQKWCYQNSAPPVYYYHQEPIYQTYRQAIRWEPAPCYQGYDPTPRCQVQGYYYPPPAPIITPFQPFGVVGPYCYRGY